MAKRGSNSDTVYAVLRRAILDQALGPGTKLPEDTIGEMLGVSRTVVRRALDRLHAEELVEVAPNRGASVAQPSLETARDVFEMRMDLERLVVQRLCGKLTTEQVRVLEKSIANEERSFRNSNPAYTRHAAKFHVLLAEIAASPLLLKYIRSLVARSALILGLYGRPNWPRCSMEEHRALLRALVDGDVRRARKLMRDHLDGMLNRALLTPAEEKRPSVREVVAQYAAELRAAAGQRN